MTAAKWIVIHVLAFTFGWFLGGLFIDKANAYEVPRDATIKVFDSNGKQIGEMSREDYKVVKIERNEIIKYKRRRNEKYYKSNTSVILHAGEGLNGNLRTDHDGTSHTIEQKRGVVGGITLCHTKDTWGLCGSAFTNKSGYLGIKKDF